MSTQQQATTPSTIKKLKIEMTLEVPSYETAWATTCRVAAAIELAIPYSEITLCKLDLDTLHQTVEPATNANTETQLRLPPNQEKGLREIKSVNLSAKLTRPTGDGVRGVDWGKVAVQSSHRD